MITTGNANFNSVTSDLEAVATYKKETHSVNFNLDDKAIRVGGGLLAQYIVYGEGVTDSPLVTPITGYTIIGWDRDFRTVTSPLNVTAQYEAWTSPNLFFSKYIEGSGYNKALEIFNPTAQEINLSSDEYKVVIYHNYNAEGAPPKYGLEKPINLHGVIGPHQTIVIKHGSADINFLGAQTSNDLEFNGNDRVVLMKGSTIIDEIGKKNENLDSRINPTGDSVKGWEMGGISTANMTLWRKDWVDRGAIHDDLGLFDPSVQWVSKGKDCFDGLGTHNCSVVHLVQFYPGEHGQLSGELTQAVYHGYPATGPGTSPETGYSFHTWDGNIASITDDIEVTAQWNANSYTVSFQSDGVGDTAARNVVYDAPYGDLPLHTKTGHNFLGWFDAITAGNEITSDTILKTASNHTLYAQWGVNSYTLSFDSMEGSDVSPITQDYGTPIDGPDDPVRTGYTFLGWEPALPATMPAENMTFEAQWELNAYAITFDTGGGSKIAPMTVNFGATIVPPANPVWSCCSFRGWRPALPATMPAEDLTVKALWNANAYTIIFDSVGGSFIPPLTQDFGTPISPPQDPVRTGYTFLGWEPALPDTMPVEGMELVAQWQINQYRLIFDSDGGSPLAPQVLDYGSEINAPVNPLRLGYRFMGWEPALPDRMGAADMTVKALWQRVGVVEGEDDETPGQGTPGTGDKPGSGQDSDLDRVPSTGESLPVTESIAFLGLAVLLLLVRRRRLFDLKKGKKEQA